MCLWYNTLSILKVDFTFKKPGNISSNLLKFTQLASISWLYLVIGRQLVNFLAEIVFFQMQPMSSLLSPSEQQMMLKRDGMFFSILHHWQRPSESLLMDVSSVRPLVLQSTAHTLPIHLPNYRALIMLARDAAGERMSGPLPVVNRALKGEL